jgi:dephospho-CoA kinase
VLRVGLTGGIACGKSHVLRRLAARGLATVDLDRVAHAVTAPGGAAHADVVAAFGEAVLGPGGAVDRKALGALVFADRAARERLEALVHPRVREEEARLAAAAEAGGRPLLVSDAALLVEAGAHLRFDRLVVVHCAPDEQLRRLVARDRLGEDAARRRIAAQMRIEEKRGFAHRELDTSGSVEETDAAADVLAEDLLRAASARRTFDEASERRLRALVSASPGTGPRGLVPAVLLEEAARAGGLELGRLARRLSPPAEGPWYRAARPGERAPWPELLAPAIAAWSLGAGMDEEWLASAAASVARLTHAEGGDVAGACLAALAAREAATRRTLRPGAPRWESFQREAARWGGAPPAPRVAASLASLLGPLL